MITTTGWLDLAEQSRTRPSQLFVESGKLPHGQRGQEETREDRNDRDDNEQFDQSECGDPARLHGSGEMHLLCGIPTRNTSC